jgi:hypothetical protein
VGVGREAWELVGGPRELLIEREERRGGAEVIEVSGAKNLSGR